MTYELLHHIYNFCLITYKKNLRFTERHIQNKIFVSVFSTACVLNIFHSNSQRVKLEIQIKHKCVLILGFRF